MKCDELAVDLGTRNGACIVCMWHCLAENNIM